MAEVITNKKKKQKKKSWPQAAGHAATDTKYRAAPVELRQGGTPAWAARAAALARGAGHPDALSEGAIPPLPLELRSLCKGA